jgi:Virulence protein RhuM family
MEGSRQVRRHLKHYSLPMIIAVGYRVRSTRGTQFRQWATARLEEYVVKGFAMDDARLKNPPGPVVPDCFDELLARIRDIRSSEKVFWRKVLQIYATSIDYDPSAEASQRFFATVQNKMHWAAHGHTAAEVIAARADADQPNMGLSTWPGAVPRKSDVTVAKNYLAADELDALNRIVSAYLELAELQALAGGPCTWPTGSPSSTTSCGSASGRSSSTPARSRTTSRWHGQSPSTNASRNIARRCRHLSSGTLTSRSRRSRRSRAGEGHRASAAGRHDRDRRARPEASSLTYCSSGLTCDWNGRLSAPRRNLPPRVERRPIWPSWRTRQLVQKMHQFNGRATGWWLARLSTSGSGD